MTYIYSRQDTLSLNYPNSAIIVGVGGTGSWAALFLAMSGCGQISLFDDDTLEPSNFNRLPLNPETCLGMLKTDAMAKFIREVRPDCNIETFGRANNFTLSTAIGQYLFDCTDQQDTQLWLSQWAKEHKVIYIRVGYNGTHVTISSHVSSWSVGQPTNGYTIVPSWVVPAALAACFGVAKAMLDPEIEVSADIGNLKVER
jgi:tRNA A37 threonylcarbamoyladenosine dehydratase